MLKTPPPDKAGFSLCGTEVMQATEANPQDITLVYEAELRKWCLERAFETRALKGPAHMVVTNLAEEYYLWITKGVSQGNRQMDPVGIDEAGMS